MENKIDPDLAKAVFSLPIDGGRLAVKFHTPRLLSSAEWKRVYQWLDLMEDNLTEPTTKPTAEKPKKIGRPRKNGTS